MGKLDFLRNKIKKNTTKLAEIANYPHRKRISITGTGQDETDYIMKLNVHRGNPVGDMVGTDIFLNNGCKTDFSDVRFLDANGNELEYYLQSHGNYEIVFDSGKLGMHNIVYKGAIYADFPIGYVPGVYKSEDNGHTWQLLKLTTNLIYIDSRGYIYVSREGSAGPFTLERSIDDGKTWGTVLDMSASSGFIKWMCMTEDNLGNLYAGRYQNTYEPAVYKSTDSGETWSACLQIETPTDTQHVHGVSYDPYTDRIYVGFDGIDNLSKKTFVSHDHGDTWVDIWTSSAADFTCMIATPQGRYFAGGNGRSGVAVFYTSDDITFTPVLPVEISVHGLCQLGNYLYAGGVEQDTSMYPQIFRVSLTDSTDIQTIWQGSSTYYNGFAGMDSMFSAAMPYGSTERHLIAGGYFEPVMDQLRLPSCRIYEGGQHYQSTFHIKIPNLPVNGMDIDVICGNPSASSESDLTIYAQPAIALPDPLVLYRFDEGEGDIVHDYSGNGRHGTIIHVSNGGEWNNYSLRRIGSTYPWMIAGGSKSYKFTGDRVEIPTDATFEALNKNFTVVAWIKTINTVIPAHIFGKGNGNNWWSLQLRSSNNYLPGVTVGNGISTVVKASPLAGHANNGQERMVGVIFNDKSPAEVAFIRDGKISWYAALSMDAVVNNNLPLTIGADAAGGNVFNGDIGEIHVYPGVLTELQVQQLHENRMVASTEPAVVTTLV